MTVNEATNSIGGTSRVVWAGDTGVGGVKFTQDDYLEALDDHVHTGIKISSKLMKKVGTLAGKRSLTMIQHQYPQSFGHALFEDSDLPTPTSGDAFNPEIITRYLMGRLRWTVAVELMARAGKKAMWKTPRQTDLKTARITMELNVARMLYLGNAQVLATTTGGDNGQPTAELYGRNDRTEAANDRYKFGTQYLRVNMPLVNIAANGGNVSPLGPIAGGSTNERFVASMDHTDPDLPTVTFKNAAGANANLNVAAADNTILIPWGSRRNTDAVDDAAMDSDLAGINGLGNLAVTASDKQYMLGVNRSSYPTMEAFSLTGDPAGTLRAFQDEFLELADDKITDEGTGDDANLLVCHSSIRREYLKIVKGLRQFGEILGKRGYGPKLVYQAGDTPMEIMADRDCPPGLFWLLDTETFGWFSEAELQSIDDGDRFVSNKAAHETAVIKSGNMACKKPHNNARIGDLIYSVSGLTAA